MAGRPQSSVEDDRARLARLRSIVRRATASPRLCKDAELTELVRLYRWASSLLAWLESTGASPRLAADTRTLVTGAHAVLFRERRPGFRELSSRLGRLLAIESPRAIRQEWRLVAATLALVYGLALVAWFAVSSDLDLAPSLLSAEAVEQEIQQLRETGPGEPFRGNFTFGIGQSPITAGWIMVHNMLVGVLFFGSALIPPLYLLFLSTNGLMLGTYTAVAGHWGQAGSISSILWCHGVLEIQALVLAGTAGLTLVRAVARPGPRSRRHALTEESRRSMRLLAPVFPLLFLAGMIEGFVSPHAPFAVRLAVAVTSGLALLAWVLIGGRSRGAASARTAP